MLLTHQPITKGVSATVTLSKTELFTIASTFDEYFSVAANVKDVLVVYESEVGNQREVLRFDLSQASPTATFLVSLKARSTFLLKQLILNDFDNGNLIIERGQLSSTVITENGTITVS